MQTEQVLKTINDIARGKAFLVGGSVRDLLLGNRPHDMDVVVPGSAQSLIFKLAEAINIKPVILNTEHDIVRAVFSGRHVDVAGLGGAASLEEDLKRRDFTINAMALAADAYLQGDWEGKFIDPLGGLNDLRKGVIRACSPLVLEDDPVRVLRALRLKGRLGFSLAPETVHLMHNLQHPLSEMPGERVWEELRHILKMPDSFRVFEFLHYEIRIMHQIFPEVAPMDRMGQNHYHADNVWKHCLKTLCEFERIIVNDNFSDEVKKTVRQYLGQPLTGKRDRLPVLKLACLFHDVGKLETRGEREDGRITFYGHHRAGSPLAEEIGRRLRMSNPELKLFRQLVEGHMQPLFLFKDAPSSGKAVLRFFRSLGEETPGCLLLSLADVNSSRTAIGRHDLAKAYREYILLMLKRYTEEKHWLLNAHSLLTGRDICDILNLPPCPLVGKLKDKLREAQMEGSVGTRRQAVEYIQEIYKRV
jgi:poly(A) polymerase